MGGSLLSLVGHCPHLEPKEETILILWVTLLITYMRSLSKFLTVLVENLIKSQLTEITYLKIIRLAPVDSQLGQELVVDPPAKFNKRWVLTSDGFISFGTTRGT